MTLHVQMISIHLCPGGVDYSLYMTTVTNNKNSPQSLVFFHSPYTELMKLQFAFLAGR